MNSKKNLDVLQIFRGIAALMVVIHHTVGYNHIDSLFLNFISPLGKYGVDFFFVLSNRGFSYKLYIVLLLVTFICVLVGYCYYLIFERYGMNQIKNYLKKINWI